MNRNSLIQLIDFINEVSKLQGNEWFRSELEAKTFPQNQQNVDLTKIDEIYELCLQKIIKEHAEKFYADFKLIGLKEKLIEDFIRMEKFRRDDNFEDFCLAAYQQVELIINYLVSKPEFIEYLRENITLPAFLKYDKETRSFVRNISGQTIGGLIFQTSEHGKINKLIEGSVNSWPFNFKFRATLYLYYFNKEVRFNSDLFDRVYEPYNFLYQGRNLNHRGSIQSEYQQKMVDNLIPNQHKFYFKFLGFLEDFITNINKHL